ncbi:MAG: universal stress protein [Akkermansiaceae bacterium]|nr:universal stress protein [Akkermansiaceae bacterium]
MKKIVAAIDFSDASKPILEAAARLAVALNEKLHLVHVVEAEPTYAAYGFSPDDFPAMHEIQEESVSRGEIKLKKMATELGVEGVETMVLQGQPLHSILEYAKEIGADMLVLGSHGHGFLGSLLLGSVAEGCVRKAEIPALIVPVRRKGEG